MVEMVLLGLPDCMDTKWSGHFTVWRCNREVQQWGAHI
uniref:ABC n=1 Tax=Arundo donax TaxID=35708 RepID=A0A0A8XQI7_ARUDO